MNIERELHWLCVKAAVGVVVLCTLFAGLAWLSL